MLDKLPEPTNLSALKAEVERRWGTIDLLDILKDTAFITGFTDSFTSVASREVLDRATLNRRLLLVLFALGTNMGIRQMAVTGEHGVGEAELRHVRATYVTRENLRAAVTTAVTTVVNATLEARDPEWWGEATSTASDSKRFRIRYAEDQRGQCGRQAVGREFHRRSLRDTGSRSRARLRCWPVAGSSLRRISVRDDLGMMTQLGHLPPSPAVGARMARWTLSGQAKRAIAAVIVLSNTAAREVTTPSRQDA